MIGCLCLHGFTGSPYEVEPIVNYLNTYTDWLVVSPVFPGHGTEGRMQHVPFQAWLQTAETELASLQKQCDKIYLVGFSMGGLIASYLAANHRIDKLVLLSAAAHYVSPKQLLKDVTKMLRDLLKGKVSENELFQRYLRKFKSTPFSMTLQFWKLVRCIRPYLSSVTAPTIILQGESDGVVPKKSAQYIYANISSEIKRIVYLPDSKHIICHDVEQEDVIQYVYTFLTDERI